LRSCVLLLISGKEADSMCEIVMHCRPTVSIGDVYVLLTGISTAGQQ